MLSTKAGSLGPAAVFRLSRARHSRPNRYPAPSAFRLGCARLCGPGPAGPVGSARQILSGGTQPHSPSDAGLIWPHRPCPGPAGPVRRCRPSLCCVRGGNLLRVQPPACAIRLPASGPGAHWHHHRRRVAQKEIISILFRFRGRGRVETWPGRPFPRRWSPAGFEWAAQRCGSSLFITPPQSIIPRLRVGWGPAPLSCTCSPPQGPFPWRAVESRTSHDETVS